MYRNRLCNYQQIRVQQNCCGPNFTPPMLNPLLSDWLYKLRWCFLFCLSRRFAFQAQFLIFSSRWPSWLLLCLLCRFCNTWLAFSYAPHSWKDLLQVNPAVFLLLFFSAFFALTSLTNSHNFLICALSFSVLTPFGWLHSVTLNPYVWHKYNFWFMHFFIYSHFSWTKLGRKTRAGGIAL